MSLDAIKGGLNNDGLKADGTEADGTLAKQAGAGSMGGGLVLETMGQIWQDKNRKKQIKSQAAIEQEALRKDQRANFGSMLAQSAGTGISGSSFQDIFSNQTIEDSLQMTQLKQDEQNKIAQSKNAKRAAIGQAFTKAGKNVAMLGMSN